MNDDPPNQRAIEIINRHPDHQVNGELLRACVAETLSRFERPCRRLVIAVVDAAEMSQLHERYLGLSEPTDVLSFDLAEAGAQDRTLEGDIAVCLDVAIQRSRERGHSSDAELALYTVHGLLHLLGYGDKNPDTSSEMHRLEDEILSAVGIGRVYGG